MADTANYPAPLQRIANASQLYQALQTTAKDPGVGSIDYSWDAQTFQASGTPSPHTVSLLREATSYLNKTLEACPAIIASTARWRAGRLQFEPDYGDVFQWRYATTYHAIQVVTTDPRIQNARDKTLVNGLQQALDHAVSELANAFDQLWQSTSAALHPHGFYLQDTVQPNLKYAVPSNQPAPASPPDTETENRP